MDQIWNFSSGPAALPKSVLEQISHDVINWNDTGFSILEMSHRSDYFANICYEAEYDLRGLLNLSNDYAIIFTHAGGHGANAFVPMNLMARCYSRNADFIVSGHWSYTSYLEAKKYGNVRIAADNNSILNHNNLKYKTRRWMPLLENWKLSKESSYIHLCSNETIDGIEFIDWPILSDMSVDSVLVVDASSNFLTRPLAIERTGLVFSCAQKNIGVAGLTVVIIRKDLLEKFLPSCPSSFNYTNIFKANSLYSTPPIFPIYVAGLMFKWLKTKGGLSIVAEENRVKSSVFYDYLDSTDFYQNEVERSVRSRVNIPFMIKDNVLTNVFLSEAKKLGLINLNGHRTVGGLRASIYNAMSMSGVLSLIKYMRDFECHYG
ncbi:3-phosphoserine/phosphohydroxythreonine transaminase [Candidatus Kinetoplastidibacterium crithidiae]|uniref:Phosphoserine aminotransferase n=1 Tax=Candidatus Kinetoplastidibacterium crithidiae TCC036E TaxID=1208918 RepID=M1M6K8_9PROT|nr:3-phosphoserine/phosphohydroxythreonine transaminase [Candidatus Kinetoplastibacterium crithidii]AFZ82624.1 phosphoserine aminotransferase [Candidatus Kinetoplastibacterium crithidii (ex Angomonas deanei ATCC 30255)]AGF47715.1 phosphoserine aminotransferase [Candidatus Kinetoplastibacterium crithidii TCC036E]